MPRMSKKRKQEWAFFLNDRNRISYNDLCRKCVYECKQSYRAIVVECPRYCSKRSKGGHNASLPRPPTDEPPYFYAALKGSDE